MIRSLFAAVMIGGLVSGCLEGRHVLTRQERLISEVGARAYAEGTEATFVSCFTTDTNSDGFITCTVQPKVGGLPSPIACGYREGMSGCKRLPPPEGEPVISR